jgi:hypothetical protein
MTCVTLKFLCIYKLHARSDVVLFFVLLKDAKLACSCACVLLYAFDRLHRTGMLFYKTVGTL